MEQEQMKDVTETVMHPEEKKPFHTTLLERIMCLAIIPAAFGYVQAIFSEEQKWTFLIAGVGILLLILSEIFYFRRKQTAERFIFLLCTLMVIYGLAFGKRQIWDQSIYCLLFLHLFIVYYILVRSDRLSEGATGHLFLWDGICGFFVTPFKNFILQIRTIISIFRSSHEKKRGKTILISLLALVCGIILLSISLTLLTKADEEFYRIVHTLFGFIRFRFDGQLILKFNLTTLVSCYLYGLLGGCYRDKKEAVLERGNHVNGFLEKLKKVPQAVWITLIVLFSAFYIGFFITQGSYLWKAFTMDLPKGYTYSQNARQGFFYMCGVTLVNFLLLWISTRTAVKRSVVFQISAGVLTVENIIFTLIAFLKILMYIQVYQFTPLRLQSIWLAAVLFFACVCILISMFSGKKTAKIWFIGSAVTLSFMCLF